VGGISAVSQAGPGRRRFEVIQQKIDQEIEVRKARVNPTGTMRPGILWCLENLSNPKLIAGIIEEPIEDVQAYVQHKAQEELRKKASSFLKRAMSLPLRPGLEDEFQRILAINVDTDHPEWVSGARIVEGLLEIAEALAGGEKSEKIAVVCDRVSSRLTPQKMLIVLGWLENYVQEGKEFVGWLRWYKEERRRLEEQK
jgi:hypothetical protein